LKEWHPLSEEDNTGFTMAKKTNYFYVFIRNSILLISKVYFRVSHLHREYVPDKGAVLIAASHRSFLDPPMVGITCKRPVHYMARHDLFKVPIIGPAIKNLNAYPVKRGTVDRGALEKTWSLLEEGEAVLIFPEGTRSKDGELQKPFAGIGMLVHKAKIPVVPCYLAGTYETFSRKMKFPYPGKVIVMYGKPLDFSNYYTQPGSREIYEKIAEEIMAAIAEIKKNAAK